MNHKQNRQEAQVSTFSKLYGKKAATIIYDGLDLKIAKLYGFFPPLDTMVLQELLNEYQRTRTVPIIKEPD